MGWSCRRPGCGREAEVCITYDAVACQVWLDPISMAPAGGQPLCADHAQRLSAPRGWVVLDRRTSQSALMTAAGVATSAAVDARGRTAVPRRRLPRGWGQFDAPRLEFVAEDEVELQVPEPTFEAPAAFVEPAVADPEPQVETVEFRSPEPAVVEPAVVEPAPSRKPKPKPAGATPLGKPKGRLLSRAFEAAGPQKSAITEKLIPTEAPVEPPTDAAAGG